MMKLMNTRLTGQQFAQAENILMEELDARREQLTPEARLVEDLGADSLTLVQIAMRMEDCFSITLPEEITEQVVTVEKLYDALATRLGQQDDERL